MFAGFSVLYLKETLRWNHGAAFLCLVGAVYFMFRRYASASKAPGCYFSPMPPSQEKAPSLEQLQAWFGCAISRPLPEAYPANPLRLGAGGRAEAGQRLRSKGGLDGFGRLGIYNQQYWFRLISVMQSDYTCAIHLMGLRPFNEWAVRYLTAHPPASPFLAELDAGFPAFLKGEYQEGDRDAVLQAVAYERALSKAFDAADGVPLASARFCGSRRAAFGPPAPGPACDPPARGLGFRRLSRPLPAR